mgnify:CR=1 FL=1
MPPALTAQLNVRVPAEEIKLLELLIMLSKETKAELVTRLIREEAKRKARQR